MTQLPDSHRLAKARELTTHLRVLQAQLNETIEELCALSAGKPTQALARAEDGTAGFSPDCLHWPMAAPVVNNPASGQTLGEGATFYTDGVGGMLQIVQQPLARHLESGYTLCFNFAQFDGEWMSVVFDARRLLQGLPDGKVQLVLAAEVAGTPLGKLQARCAWAGAHHAGERHCELRHNQLNRAEFEIDYLDPALTSAFDLHLVITPAERGAIELRGLSLSLRVIPVLAAQGAAQVGSVFESLS